MLWALERLAAGLAVGLFASAATPARAAEVERVVAVVRSPAAPEPRVLTLGEVEEEARIALVSRGAVLAASRPLDAPAMEAGLEWLIDQVLLDAEATRLQVFEIERGEVLAELARFKEQFAREADFQALLVRCDMTEGDLEEVLRRMLRVRRYLESRVSHAGQVSEADVSAFLAAHPADAQARDREQARARLGQERMEQEATSLVQEVRGRAEIRLLADPKALATPDWPEGT